VGPALLLIGVAQDTRFELVRVYRNTLSKSAALCSRAGVIVRELGILKSSSGGGHGRTPANETETETTARTTP
jgi:hypothetical protein